MRRKPAENDNSWLGIAGVGECNLYSSDGTLLGHCMETPNSVAFAMVRTGAAYSLGVERYDRDSAEMRNRVANAGWL